MGYVHSFTSHNDGHLAVSNMYIWIMSISTVIIISTYFAKCTLNLVKEILKIIKILKKKIEFEVCNLFLIKNINCDFVFLGTNCSLICVLSPIICTKSNKTVKNYVN